VPKFLGTSSLMEVVDVLGYEEKVAQYAAGGSGA